MIEQIQKSQKAILPALLGVIAFFADMGLDLPINGEQAGGLALVIAAVVYFVPNKDKSSEKGDA